MDEKICLGGSYFTSSVSLMVSKQFYSRTILKQIKFYLNPTDLVTTVCVQIPKITFFHLYNKESIVNRPAKQISKPFKRAKNISLIASQLDKIPFIFIR